MYTKKEVIDIAFTNRASVGSSKYFVSFITYKRHKVAVVQMVPPDGPSLNIKLVKNLPEFHYICVSVYFLADKPINRYRDDFTSFILHRKKPLPYGELKKFIISFLRERFNDGKPYQMRLF